MPGNKPAQADTDQASLPRSFDKLESVLTDKQTSAATEAHGFKNPYQTAIAKLIEANRAIRDLGICLNEVQPDGLTEFFELQLKYLRALRDMWR